MKKEWTNIGLQWVLKASHENFTTETGLKIRKFISPAMKCVLKLATKKHINVESKPKLEKGKPYIFVSSHSYDEDIISSLATTGRPTYVLIGSTDQIKHNPQIYAAWASGLIYVDRMDTESRKDSLLKMEYALDHDISVLIFVEGSLNNSINSLVLGEGKIFASPYILAQKTGCQVVPIGNYNKYGSKEININYGKPIDMVGKDKEEALIELRDTMATMYWNFLEKLYPTEKDYVKRSSLGEHYVSKYYEERVNIYDTVKWSSEIDWDEELSHYINKKTPFPKSVWESFKDVRITKDNIDVMLPILKQIGMYDEENFNEYIKKFYEQKRSKMLVKKK